MKRHKIAASLYSKSISNIQRLFRICSLDMIIHNRIFFGHLGLFRKELIIK